MTAVVTRPQLKPVMIPALQFIPAAACRLQPTATPILSRCLEPFIALRRVITASGDIDGGQFDSGYSNTVDGGQFGQQQTENADGGGFL